MNKTPKFGRATKKKAKKKAYITKGAYQKMQKINVEKSLDDFFKEARS